MPGHLLSSTNKFDIMYVKKLIVEIILPTWTFKFVSYHSYV
jgi:hypothetical protein